MGRVLAVGDIHGGLRALRDVLYKCGYDSKTDDLIFLGDYVDGWPESADVVDFIIGLKEKIRFEMRHPDSIICLEGNHDQWIKEFLTYGTIHPDWLENGGKTTLSSYETFWQLRGKDQESMDAHRDFYNSLHNYYIDKDGRAFVHAGCDSEQGVQKTFDYTRKWDRIMWNRVLSGKIVKAHKELFIGHTTTTSYICKPHYPEAQEKGQEIGKYISVPINRQNVWNLDTGGGWDGKLTIMDVNTKEYWQSEFVYKLYPECEGRGPHKKPNKYKQRLKYKR